MKSIFGVLGITIVAAVGGAAEGLQVLQLAHSAPPPSSTALTVAAEEKKMDPKSSSFRELKPIITNLAAPAGTWVRLEAVLIFDGAGEAHDEPIVAEFTTDTIAYMRTLSAAQLEGADGLRRLREDLNERAGLRSDHKIREVLIETLVVQ